MRLQYDHKGNFTIASDAEHISDPAMYNGIASLQANGKTFIVVSGYYEQDYLNPETVYEIIPVETEAGPADLASEESAPHNLFVPDDECDCGVDPVGPPL